MTTISEFQAAAIRLIGSGQGGLLNGWQRIEQAISRTATGMIAELMPTNAHTIKATIKGILAVVFTFGGSSFGDISAGGGFLGF